MKKSMPPFFPEKKTLDWLLQGDPSIRWQVMRDLMDADVTRINSERSRITSNGWGSRLLKKQDADGRWDQSLYNHKWISTTYTLLLLRQLGLEAKNSQALSGCQVLMDAGFSCDHGINFWPKQYAESETCVTGMILSIVCHFQVQDERIPLLVDHLLKNQMADGGWNCRSSRGATHSSFHTTISVLEGLHAYQNMTKATRALTNSQGRGREFFLEHKLFRSHRTEKIVKPAMTRFSFPPQWHYDVLRGLDYFQATDAPWDDRLQDAVDLVIKRKGKNGRWSLQNRHSGRSYFEMEKVGAASRWNTLRALRVLAWYQRVSPTS